MCDSMFSRGWLKFRINLYWCRRCKNEFCRKMTTHVQEWQICKIRNWNVYCVLQFCFFQDSSEMFSITNANILTSTTRISVVFDFQTHELTLLWFTSTSAYYHSNKTNHTSNLTHDWGLFLFTTYDGTCNDVHVNTFLECWGKRCNVQDC